jgi:hypothetical protein
MALTRMLHLQDFALHAELMDALLVCPDITLEAIAAVFDFAPEVVHLEDQLFFNFRDRRSETLYTCRLCPATELQTPGAQLKAVAFKTKKSGLVLAAAGICPAPELDESVELLGQEIEQALLQRAISGLRQGQADPKTNRALSLVQEYLLPLRGQRQAIEPLYGTQFDREDLRVLYKDHDARLALLQGHSPERRSPKNEKALCKAEMAATSTP